MKKFSLSMLVTTLLAGSAFAQLPTVTVSTQPFVPLTGATDVTSQFSDTDDGALVLQLPFSFPYLGQNVTSVLIDTNGFLSFDTGCLSSSCFSNTAFPNTGTPNNMIAPWWDDMALGSATRVYVRSTASEFVVEWNQLNSLSTTSTTVTMQARLAPSGTFYVHYGPKSGTGMAASAGFENAAGSLGANFLTCGTSCNSTNFPTDTLYTVGEPAQSELIVASVTVSNIAEQDAGTLTMDVQATIRNLGRTPASNFGYSFYLSSDKIKDAGDLLIATGGPISLSASNADGGSPVANVTAQAATGVALASGTYYVLCEVDPTNAVTEAIETNNVSSTAAPFIQGLDLVATSITGVASSGGGNVDTIRANFFNQGTRPAGMVNYKIFLSTNTTWDAADFQIYSGTRAVSGGETVAEVLSVTMPVNVPDGDLYYLLQIDPANAITEAIETNNVVASTAKVSVKRADIVVDSALFLDPVTNATTANARFGESARVMAHIANTGGANANDFYMGVVLSNDSQLSLLSDQVIYEELVPQLPSSALADGGMPSRNLALDFTIPVARQADGGMPYPTGPYYLFVVADTRSGVFESKTSNNFVGVGSGPIRISAPGGDLTVSSVQAPAAGGVGEALPVSRTIRNVGNVDAPAVHYRYYASANTIITPDDIPLEIVSGNTTIPAGSVTLAHNSGSSLSEMVKLPGTMAAGTYYIGCIVDSDDVVAEIDENNNALASNAIQIAASSLRVNGVQLPDATIGRAYVYRLSSTGDQATATWTVLTAQGPLPEGLMLASDGTISGTPTGTTAQIASFTVAVSDDTRSAAARLVMRVLPPSSQLEITSDNIPAVINSPNTMYRFGFAAAGGVKPYQWKISSGVLPGGLSLSADGILSGSPRAGSMDGATPVTVQVSDASGTTVQVPFFVRLVAPGSFVIRTAALPDGIMGQDYLQDIAVDNLDGSPLATPVYWTTAGALPDGLSLMQETAVLTVQGTPQNAGSFHFTVTAEDARGRTDSVDMVLRVYAPRFRITGDFSAILAPGQEVNVALAANPANASAQFSLVSGTLPPGLSLSKAGVVSGTVADMGSEGAWNFVVEASSPSGISGLAAFSTVVERPAKIITCSSTGGGMAPIALVVALLAFLRRSRRLSFALGLVLLVPGAFAQTYQVDGPRSISFSPLAAAGSTALNPGFSGVNVSLPFAFPFYGSTVSSLGFSRYGYLALGGGDPSWDINAPIPSSSGFVDTFIAPWWDALNDSYGSFRWAVQGVAPFRVAVFEWNSVRGSGGTGPFTFQTLLYESTGQIRFAYNTAMPAGSTSASIGIQNTTSVGVGGTSCGAAGNCGISGFPAGQAIDFFRPPDLLVASVSAEQVGYAGVAFRASANLRNTGGRVAAAVVTRFYLSTDSAIDSSDPVIGEATSLFVNVGAETVATGQTSIPMGTAPGNYFILARTDPDNTIPEQNESNNSSPAVSMSVGMPKADLVVSSVSSPGTAAPGASIQVMRSISNAGNAAAGAFKYTYFLSDNSVVSISDRVLSPGGNIASLNAAAVDMGMDTVTLPATLPSGQYWVGACVNIDGANLNAGFVLDEISVVNNCFSATAPILVSTGTVLVTTTSVPGATQYAPFGMRLSAAGGSGQYTWSLNGGALPAGVTLAPSGDLTGTPAAVGTFSFEVKASSGTQSATKALTLEVSSGTLPLVIVDQDLPTAEFGRAYSAAVVGVGGKPPYQWALNVDTKLPAGLALSSDGRIEGRASEAKDASFTLVLTDSAGATANKDLSIRVVSPSTLAIATNALPTAYIKREFVQPLIAVGGRAPYTWSVTSFRKLPQNATEVPGNVETALPDWLGLAIDDGLNDDVLLGTPKVAGLYAVTLKVTDTNGAEDSVALELLVSYLDGFAITTTALPDAFVNQNYAVKLSHNGGSESEGVNFSLPCVEQAVKVDQFACVGVDASQVLPDGLSLGSAGEILGIPTREGIYTFLVKATDNSGRQDFRGLSIRVRPDYKQQQKGGCSGTGVDPSLVSILALMGLALRRRR